MPLEGHAIVDAGRVEAAALPGVPLALARVAGETRVTRVALVARVAGAAVLAGAFEAVMGDVDARRHSGGPTVEARPGDTYLVYLDSRGMEAAAAEVHGLLEALTGRAPRGGLHPWGVLAVGETQGYGYVEVYSPSKRVEELAEALVPDAVHAEFDPVLVEAPARALRDPGWIDAMPGEPDVRVAVETSEGFRVGLAGFIDEESGLVRDTYPDHTFYAYPPGHVRAVFHEISGVPPSPPLAVHTMNALFGGARVLGASPLEVVEAVNAYLEEAYRLLHG